MNLFELGTEDMKSNTGQTKLKARLSRYLSAFRQGSGVPLWLVSDTATAMFIEQVDKWIHLLPPLGFGEALDSLQYSPYFERIPVNLIRAESKRWAESNQIREALLAADRLLCSLTELWRQGKLTHVGIMLGTLPVVGALFWSAEGIRIMPEVARILGCSEATPAQVFDSYRVAVESGDEDTLLEIRQLIDGDSTFSSWSRKFSDTAAKVKLPERPRPVPLINLVPSILLRILEMEEKDDNDREDN